MPRLIKIAEPDELPPGKGKTLRIDGREITVTNQEGRLEATGTWTRHITGAMDTTCELPGHRFDVGGEHTPDRLRTDELRYQVIARDDGVFVVLEDGHVHPGEEPRVGPTRRRS